jgi:hypothetical protein
MLDEIKVVEIIVPYDNSQANRVQNAGSLRDGSRDKECDTKITNDQISTPERLRMQQKI